MLARSAVLLFLLLCSAVSGYSGISGPFNDGWDFVCDAVDEATTNQWQGVDLPHTARIEPLFLGNKMWMGQCVYRKTFTPDSAWKEKKVFLQFEGAMHTAVVKLNGKAIANHSGGYLPFQVDLSNDLKFGQPNEIIVLLNNREDPNTPPGKWLGKLDFAWYHGLYRNVNLVVTDKIHITDPVAENLPASGGVLVSYSEVSEQSATVHARIHVRNESSEGTSVTVWCLFDGRKAGSSEPITISAGNAAEALVEFKVPKPRLWSPQAPNLYTLYTQVIAGGKAVDGVETKCGIRTVSCSAEGFIINGKKMFLRGTNRHQEYPYLGYALSDAAQWRDAWLIKQGGFDLVRLSHYPQAPAFLDACDQYGLVVMEPVPGWQYFGNDVFAKRSLQNARDMIRRDRNHPSCIFWETSLNETRQPAAFLKEMHEIVKKECPGTFSASHLDGCHDVYIPARQHASGPKFWDDWKNGNKAMFTAEYGDWEYYADKAANFNQTGARELKSDEANSRQRRSDTEKRLLQQALNFQEAHNQNRRNPAMIGDANWLFNDYNRGYAPDHCASGVVDIFRIPKFVYYFYQSQRNPEGETFASPMVYIASFWTEKSPLSVRVFSNCEEVELFLNGKKIARQKPYQDQFSDRLNHQPFTFALSQFVAGELKAVAYINGKKTAEHVVRTPGKAVGLKVVRADMGNPVAKGTVDTVLVYAEFVDENGTLVVSETSPVNFAVEGAELVSPPTVNAEAGIATAVVKTSGKPFNITAKSESLPTQN